ncbi:glycerophosphodiester phosphodiesterase [Halovenus sp. WSH3]|uniref:Glycerophosphodiester phosphodiesterase n=1 Tax=Halovenus carboxidivorans TaxID=2692199 RepID=A0A6B0T324_9EURY|nr:glycerophosphodiester phosphodiesterase [Halovenus carboxidivorans]MXR52425.1 glycerophosphodiester phosphodiesterase [Halovenus carboxidivorans]
MQVIGHRGCAAEFPENTLAAIRGCAPHVDLIEIDVQRCRSGELVVFHDDTVDRLTDATGAVADFDYEELTTLTVGDSDQSIPTLGEVLDALPEDTGVNVELKRADVAGAVLDALADSDAELIVSSFDPAALAPFQGHSIPTAFLFAHSFEAGLQTALDLGCAFVHPRYAITDAADIRRAHEHGMSVNAWTVPTEAGVRRLKAGGVDGVIVDTWRIIPGERTE